jgi:hypothetical protein
MTIEKHPRQVKDEETLQEVFEYLDRRFSRKTEKRPSEQRPILAMKKLE